MARIDGSASEDAKARVAAARSMSRLRAASARGARASASLKNGSRSGGALPDLVAIAGGDPKRVLTISDFAAAHELGARDSFHEDPATRSERFDPFPEFAQLAADGKFTVPIAATYPLEDWRTAMEVSLTGRARGKLLLLP
jgi:NADPH:quinone reductase-like Zn-dependent oxidoreductase